MQDNSFTAEPPFREANKHMESIYTANQWIVIESLNEPHFTDEKTEVQKISFQNGLIILLMYWINVM